MQSPRDPNRDRVERERYVAGDRTDREMTDRDRSADRESMDRERNVEREPMERERQGDREYRRAGYFGAAPAASFTDLVRWGPILAGFAATVAVLILMGILGAAIGLGVADPAAADTTFAAIWGAVSLIVAFFVGGWVAARTSAVGGQLPAIMNAAVVWALTLLFALFLAGLGVVGLLGAVEAFVVPDTAMAGQAALWALLALLLGLAAAIVGGLVGMHRESEYVER